MKLKNENKKDFIQLLIIYNSLLKRFTNKECDKIRLRKERTFYDIIKYIKLRYGDKIFNIMVKDNKLVYKIIWKGYVIHNLKKEINFSGEISFLYPISGGWNNFSFNNII